MPELFQTLIDLVRLIIVQLLPEVLLLILHTGLVLFWVAWWLWGVNWKKAWPVLAEGAWVPLTLIVLMGAIVWSQIFPRDLPLFGSLVLTNLWWQLIALGLLAGSALFLGWLQGYFGWTPHAVDLEPVPLAADHGHH